MSLPDDPAAAFKQLVKAVAEIDPAAKSVDKRAASAAARAEAAIKANSVVAIADALQDVTVERVAARRASDSRAAADADLKAFLASAPAPLQAKCAPLTRALANAGQMLQAADKRLASLEARLGLAGTNADKTVQKMALRAEELRKQGKELELLFARKVASGMVYTEEAEQALDNRDADGLTVARKLFVELIDPKTADRRTAFLAAIEDLEQQAADCGYPAAKARIDAAVKQLRAHLAQIDGHWDSIREGIRRLDKLAVRPLDVRGIALSADVDPALIPKLSKALEAPKKQWEKSLAAFAKETRYPGKPKDLLARALARAK